MEITCSEKLKNCMEQVIEFSKLSYARSLVSAAGGNVSMRCGEYVIITGTGISLRDVEEENLVICDLSGNVLSDNGLRPSKEIGFHLAIYKLRDDVDSIIHVHPTYSVAYTYNGKEIPMATGSAEMKLKRIPIVKSIYPGTKELVAAVAEVVKEAGPEIHSIVLQRHGIVVYEKGMTNCFNTAELTEDTARISVLAAI